MNLLIASDQEIDEAVDYFRNNPKDILEGWANGRRDDDMLKESLNGHLIGTDTARYGRILFGSVALEYDSPSYGCATQAKDYAHRTEWDDISDWISDSEIPNHYVMIHSNLDLFGELARMVRDKRREHVEEAV